MRSSTAWTSGTTFTPSTRIAWQFEMGGQFHAVALFQHRAVGREDEPDIMIEVDDGTGQARGYVCEPAGFDQRMGFAAGEQDFHQCCLRRVQHYRRVGKPQG